MEGSGGCKLSSSDQVCLSQEDGGRRRAQGIGIDDAIGTGFHTVEGS